METTLEDLKALIEHAIEKYGVDKVIDVYNSAGDKLTGPLVIEPNLANDESSVEFA